MPIEKRDDEITPERGARYMEMVAGLMAMMGETEVVIPRDCLPMTGFSVWHRASDDGDGILVRVVREGTDH